MSFLLSTIKDFRGRLSKKAAKFLCVLVLFAPFLVFSQETDIDDFDFDIDIPESDSVAEDTVDNEETEYVSDLDIEELRRRIYGEDPAEFISLSLRDANVSLFLTGSWKGALQFNFGLSHSPLGFSFAAPETPVLFKQEADLTMSLWLNDRWFVEANFLDDYVNNTYRAGYQGMSGEFLQYAGIGNTGLDFPSFPYMDLGGDSPSSFGFYSLMGRENLNIHALFRYDSASREERVFSGSRERTFNYVRPQDFIAGIAFVLPDTDIDADITVYIEDEKGALKDTNGRGWRVALSTEYAAGRTSGLLDLSKRPDGMVAVSYSKGGNNRPWALSMGSYGGSAGDYLLEVQNQFDPDRIKIRLEDYPQCWINASVNPLTFEIGGVPALVTREKGTFSPFERQNRYDAPSSASETAVLTRLSTGRRIDGYELTPLEANAASADIPLYAASASQRGIYELLPEARIVSYRDPRTLWPLAREFPEIYLPPAGNYSVDAVLRFTNFSGAEGYHIGTDVVSGSIQVWRSGIQDTNFSYNASSGEIVLNGAVGQNELIRVTYLKRNEETRLGSIAAGLGAVYHNGASPFSAQAALGIRWNLTESSSYTESGASSAGTVGLGGKTAWAYDNFKAHVTAGFALEQTDTTGLYRAAGMEGNETIMSTPPERAFISNPPTTGFPVMALGYANRANLIYRNYYSGLGSALMPITWQEAEILDRNRPYPVKDPLLGDSQTLAAEFTMRGGQWTGFQIPVDLYSEALSGAVEIEIPYRFYGVSGDDRDFQLIIQIGSLSGEDLAFTENLNLILEGREIFDAARPIHDNPAILRFSLSAADRQKLGDAKYARVIAVYNGFNQISGRVLVAPPIIRGAAFRPVILDSGSINGIPDLSSFNQVRAYETIDTGIDSLERAYGDIIKRLHPADAAQRALKIEWDNARNGVSVGVDGRLAELPLSDYRELSFFVKGPRPAISNATLSFIVAGGPDSISDSQLRADIPMSALKEGQWSKVTIHYQGKDLRLSVDGTSIPAASLSYRPRGGVEDASSGKAGYVAILINPPDNLTSLPSGSIYVDEIILEDASLVYRLNAGGAVEFRKRGTLFGLGGHAVFSDFLISNTLESETRANGARDSGASGSVANRTGAEISVLGAKIRGNLLFTAAKDTFLWSADHLVSRTIGPFSLKESFYAAPRDGNIQRNVNIAFSSDFYARFDADALNEYSRLRRKWNLGAGYRSNNDFVPSVAVSADAAWTRKNQVNENDGYAKLWFNSWEHVIPDAGREADIRKTQGQFVLTENTKPVGVVLTLDGGVNFTQANNLIQNDSSAFLDIPVALERWSANFRAGRGFKKQLYYSGDNALDDAWLFLRSVGDSLAFWKVTPGYSLFASSLNAAMDEAVNNSSSSEEPQYTSFNDHFSARVNLPRVYSLASFVIPSRATLRLERLMEQKLDIRTDVFNLGVGVGFSVVNMFGLMGYKPLFKFYHNDEFNYAFETAAIFSDDKTTWRVQSAIGAAFRGFSGGVMNISNNFTVRTDGYWLESLKVNWITPTEKNLLSLFYDWIKKITVTRTSWINLGSILRDDYEQFRKESFELTVDKSDSRSRVIMTAGHEATVRILGRLELNAFINLRFSDDKPKESFTFDTLLGVTLRISF